MTIQSEVLETVQIFERQLSHGDLCKESEIVLQCCTLVRLASLSAWSDDQSNDCTTALACVSAVVDPLKDAEIPHSCIEAVADRITRILRHAGSKKAASVALNSFIQYVTKARSMLSENVVAAFAGGPAKRGVLILGVPHDSLTVDALVEAVAEMDALHVAIVQILPDDETGVRGIESRLGSIDGVSIERVKLSEVSRILRSGSLHAVLIDAVAMDGQKGVVARSGAALVCAAARMFGVRVFALGLFYRMVREDSSVVQRLRSARGHPGAIMTYECAKENGSNFKVLNPVYDYLGYGSFDSVITDVGSSASGDVRVHFEFDKFPIQE